jgi:uncharacterized protein YigA (DUF484 family)
MKMSTNYTDLCARLLNPATPYEHLSEPVQRNLAVSVNLWLLSEAAAAIRELEKERDALQYVADEGKRLWSAAEAKVARLEGELQWQAEQPEAHPFMAMRARAALTEGTKE